MPTATTPPARPSDEPGAKEAPTIEATSSAPCYQRRAAADAADRTAQDALDAARAGVASTKQALADAEGEAAGTMAAAIGGDGASTRTAVDKSLARVEKARSDVEWSDVELQAAELATARAAEVAAQLAGCHR
jgi:hypothetical protein